MFIFSSASRTGAGSTGVVRFPDPPYGVTFKSQSGNLTSTGATFTGAYSTGTANTIAGNTGATINVLQAPV